MNNDQMVKLTVSSQIAAQIAKQYCKYTDMSEDEIASKVVSLTDKITNDLYAKL